jgi:hypothetical protein
MKLETRGIGQMYWNREYDFLFDEEKFKNIVSSRKHSEHSEDVFLDWIFDISNYKGYFVDVGAYGETSSNTYRLIDNSWKGLLIYFDPNCIREMTNEFADNKDITVIDTFVTPGKIGYPTEKTCLTSILKSHEVPQDFDFLSIDVDSYEFEVWTNLKDYEPKLICIECTTMEDSFDVINYDPSYLMYKYTNRESGYGGATVALLNKLAEEKGYDYLCKDVSNVMYIKKGFKK